MILQSKGNGWHFRSLFSVGGREALLRRPLAPWNGSDVGRSLWRFLLVLAMETNGAGKCVPYQI